MPKKYWKKGDPLDFKVGDQVMVRENTEYGALENHVGFITSINQNLYYPLGVRVANHGVLALRPRDVVKEKV